MLPPARRARHAALFLSVIAVLVSIACGWSARTAYTERDSDPDVLMRSVLLFLVLLLVALLLRMGAAICELLWLERTWSNLPGPMRNIGPMKDVGSGMLIGISFVPGVAWLWKLGIIVGVADGFAAMGRPVPKRLGMAAVIVSWIPGLNVYVAPFLWELFARRIDRATTSA